MHSKVWFFQTLEYLRGTDFRGYLFSRVKKNTPCKYLFSRIGLTEKFCKYNSSQIGSFEKFRLYLISWISKGVKYWVFYEALDSTDKERVSLKPEVSWSGRRTSNGSKDGRPLDPFGKLSNISDLFQPLITISLLFPLTFGFKILLIIYHWITSRLSI